VTRVYLGDPEVEMTSHNRSTADQIGKVFLVRGHGLRECMVCGELFTQSTAPAHAEANCYLLQMRKK
jgi:hypothetical protein